MIKAKDLKKAGWITFFVLPGAAIVIVFIIVPLFMSLFNSFFDWNAMSRGEFVGFKILKSSLRDSLMQNASPMLWAIT